jgi:hypothetical protein
MVNFLYEITLQVVGKVNILGDLDDNGKDTSYQRGGDWMSDYVFLAIALVAKTWIIAMVDTNKKMLVKPNEGDIIGNHLKYDTR